MSNYKGRIVSKKGGPGSGNYGHRGRPGEVGGSASGNNGGRPSDVKDSWEQLTSPSKEKAGKFGRGYFINADNELIDIIMPGFEEIGGNTHMSWLVRTKHPELVGLTKDEAKRPHDGHTVRKLYGGGVIRVREFDGKPSITTAEVNVATLRRLQRLYDANKLHIPLKGGVWSNPRRGGYVAFTLEEFLSAKHIVKVPGESNQYQFKQHKVVIKGGKGSGYFGHRGRPGKVGGSAGKLAIHSSVRDLVNANTKNGRLVRDLQFYIDGNTGKVISLNNKYQGGHGEIAENIIERDGIDYNPYKESSEAVALKHGYIRGYYVRNVQSMLFDANPVRTKQLRMMQDSIAGLGNIIKKIMIDSWREGNFNQPGFLRIHFNDFTYDEFMEASGVRLIHDQPIRLKQRKVVIKGGAGSGNFGHAGRPGKIGGSTKGVGRAALDDFRDRIERKLSKNPNARWNELGTPGQGAQANTSIVRIDYHGARGIRKQYHDVYAEMANNDAFAAELAAIADLEVVPPAVIIGEGDTIQKFIPNAKTVASLAYVWEDAGVRERDIYVDGMKNDSGFVQDMLFMDIAGGNIDRHGNNMLVDKGGKLWAIDNSMMWNYDYESEVENYTDTWDDNEGGDAVRSVRRAYQGMHMVRSMMSHVVDRNNPTWGGDIKIDKNRWERFYKSATSEEARSAMVRIYGDEGYKWKWMAMTLRLRKFDEMMRSPEYNWYLELQQ